MSDNKEFNNSDFLSENQDILNQMVAEQESQLSGSAGFVDSKGEFNKLFEYKYKSQSNSFVIEPTDIGRSISKNFMTEGELGLHSDSFEIEMSADNIVQLANIFHMPAYSLKDIEDVVGIHHSFNDPDEFISKVKEHSPLMAGSPAEIEDFLETRNVVLKEYVIDFSKSDNAPLLIENDIYRYENNQLIAMERDLGGLENAFKHAAIESLNRVGVLNGGSKIVRESAKGEDRFSLLVDKGSRSPLPATRTNEGFQVYERFNQAGSLPVSFKHLLAGSGMKFAASNPEFSANRLGRMLEKQNSELHRKFTTSMIFNSLIGADAFDAQNVGVNISLDASGKLVSKFDLVKSFTPEFSKNNNEYYKAPLKMDLSDVIKDPVINEIYFHNPDMVKSCYEDAVKARNIMLEIIGSELTANGVLTHKEADQFNQFLLKKDIDFNGFKADGTARATIFEPDDDNIHRFQDKIRQQHRSTADDLSYN